VARFVELPPASLQLLKNLSVGQSRWSNQATAEYLLDGLTKKKEEAAYHEHLAGGIDKRANCLVQRRTTEDFEEHAPHRPDVNLLSDLCLAIEKLGCHVL